MSKPQILYVDDERTNLSTFKHAFKANYEIFLASSAKEGFDILEYEPSIALVISDQHMPEMTGAAFLKIVSERYPKCIKMIMTDYTNIDPIIDVINDCGIFQFITKPWNINTLQMVLTKAYEVYKLRQDKEILLQQLEEINQSLEEKVAIQTIQLQNQNKELKKLNIELQQAHHQVKEKKLFLEKVMNILPNSIYIWDCENNELIYKNKSKVNYLNYYAQEVHRHVDSPHQVDREMVKQHIGQFKYMEPNEHIELTYCLPDDQNQLKWLMSRETIFKTNAQGKPAQILGITQDITSMKKAKQRLETFKNGLRALKLISSDTSLDFDTQLKNAIRFITNYWGMDLGIIADVEDDVFKVINSFSLNEQYKLNGVRHFNATNKRFIHQDALGITSMSDSTPHTHPCFSHLPVTSYIGCDYWVNGKRAGMINIISTSDKSMHFGAYDMDFIRLFAKWVGFTLERANSTKKLKNLNESKDRILATVAHDLRSPINSIKGTMAVMKHQLEDRIETEDQELFDLIEDSCSKTLSLIQELLDISEMENENYRLITEQVPINPFIEKTLKPYHEKINTKQVSLQLYLEETEKTLVKINRQKFARVIENLTSNALKFTPKTGNISICTSLSKDQVNIIISDTGIGIPEKLHPFIFNKFSNARRAGLQGEKSTGLGMAIVKQIIHLHQGAITFKSAENQGTMFTISLPLL